MSFRSDEGLEGLNYFDSSIDGYSSFGDFSQDVDGSVHAQTAASGTSYDNAVSAPASNYARSDAGDPCDTNQLFSTNAPLWGVQSFINSHGYDAFPGEFEQVSVNQFELAPHAQIPHTIGPPYYTDMPGVPSGESEIHLEDVQLASPGPLTSLPQIRVDPAPSGMQSWVHGAYNAGDRNNGVADILALDLMDSRPNPSSSYGRLELNEDQQSESSINTSNTGHSCPSCPNKYFDSKDDLRRHRRYHNPRNHTCDCGKGFVHPKDLRRHQKTHTSAPGLPCPVKECSRTFKASRHDNMKRHVQKQHPGVGVGGL